MTIHDLSSNEYYAIVNRRFDEREQVLLALGFERQTVDHLNLAVYVRGTLFRYPDVVQTSFMAFADDRAWLDRLADIKRK